MKIAIFSDIHDNIPNLEKFINWCRDNKIKELICCGDVTTIETMEEICEKFSGTIHLALGNIDMFDCNEVSKLYNLKCYGKIGRVKIGGRWLGLCHEPYLINKAMEEGNCDIIFYGHTHKPWIEEKAGTTIANPGTLGGVFQSATFAIFDCQTAKLDLKLLHKI